MKKLVTQGYYILFGIILLLGTFLSANAQYIGTTLEKGGLYTSITKDANNNLYVIRVKPGTAGAIYQVVKYTNGTGTPVSIYNGLTHEISDYPWGLAVAANGDVYVSNDFTTGGGAIIKLTYNAGNYTASTFKSGRYYSALAIDGNNNLYTAEYDVANGNYAVSKYPSGGAASSRLFVNLKSGAGYTYPTGLAVAANGDVYVADAFSNVPAITDGGHIYKLTAASSYAVSTVSTGYYSTTLTIDASGNLFSSENRGAGYGLVEYPNGSGAGVPVFNGLHANGIYYPWGIAVYSPGKIFVADGDDGVNGGAVIQLSYAPPTVTTAAVTGSTAVSSTLNGLVNDNGNTTTVTFTYSTSPALAGGITLPATTGGTINAGSGSTAVAVNIAGLAGSTKYYYRTTATNIGGTIQGAILSFLTPPSISYSTPVTYNSGTGIPPLSPVATAVALPAYGSTVITGSGFTMPFAVAADVAGNVYVADFGNKLLKKIPAGGGASVTLQSGFTSLLGVAVDAANNVYVADAGTALVKKIPNGGTGTPVVIGSGFVSPYGIAVDAAGNVYVADYNNNAVYKIAAADGSTTPVGSGFATPTTVAVDATGNVFVADYGHALVKEIPAGSNTPITIGSGFSAPAGVCVDPSGNVFVADYGNSTVQELPVGGGAQIAIGSGYQNPSGVTVDGFGKVYVAGYLSNLIDQITPVGGYYLSTALPSGLTINPKTGVISGTVTVISPAKNYTITAYNAGGGTSAVVNLKVSPNANLANLAVTQGSLSPVFAAGTVSYTESVPNDVTSILVTPTTRDVAATVTVNGTPVSSGIASEPVALNAGANAISVVVTAQDGVTTKTYTITVNRAASSNALLSNLTPGVGVLNPAFTSGNTSYHTAVGNGIASITLTPVSSDPTATITINGTPVISGSASGPLALNVGANTITTVVTAQDGVTTQTYTITVTRAASTNANLLTLSTSNGALTPSFSSGTTSYTKTVGGIVTSMTFTPTSVSSSATITVNGITVTSGSASNPIVLNGGNNVINIVVTAQDGVTTKTYTITVTRNASTNADLANLQLSTGTLTPVFATATTSYHTAVGSGTSSITITPTTSDATASILVNGAPVSSGSASGPITLSVGSNIITTVVTAQDNLTKLTYTVTVNRAASTNAKLLSLATSNGALTPAFNNTITSYTRAVSNATTSITFTPTTVDPNATVTINGASTPSGAVSAAQTLVVGNNVENIKVTAQDGVTAITYTVTVTRASGSMNSVYEPVSVAKPNDSPRLTEDNINVHQGVSPNGDGINDFLVIENIANYPDNKLQVMNRSGQLIFEAKGYDNSSKIFDGHSNKTGAMQLPGTYFYSLDYVVNGTAKHKTGFIVLKY